MKNIGIYIHIPFCTGKCPYCDFFSINYSHSEINKYTDMIVQRIQYYSGIYNCKADTLYIGGGTPSLCGTDNLIKIISAAKKYFLTDDYEATVEVNPTSSPLLDFKQLRKSGYNRISIGLQSANENELKTLGRRHNCKDAADTLKMAKSGGFDNISMDVMLAVPHQTHESLKRTIDFCAESSASHISAYILKIEDNTPFAAMADTLPFFDDDAQADFYSSACEYLKAYDYEQYEISNFCKNGKKGKHNLKYWNCDEYLGIGASAHSFINSKRFYTPRFIQDFYSEKTIDDGAGGSFEEYIMLRLRLTEGLLFSSFSERYGRSFPVKKCENTLNKLKNADLIVFDDSHIALSDKGFLVSNHIISDILYDISE